MGVLTSLFHVALYLPSYRSPCTFSASRPRFLSVEPYTRIRYILLGFLRDGRMQSHTFHSPLGGPPRASGCPSSSMIGAFHSRQGISFNAVPLHPDSLRYRGTSLIGNAHPPRTNIGPWAQSCCKVLGRRCLLWHSTLHPDSLTCGCTAGYSIQQYASPSGSLSVADCVDPSAVTLHPTPYTLHPTPCTLHPAPYTLRPTPCTLHLAPCLPTQETTQRQIDGFFSQLSFQCYLPEVASVGDGLGICSWVALARRPPAGCAPHHSLNQVVSPEPHRSLFTLFITLEHAVEWCESP